MVQIKLQKSASRKVSAFAGASLLTSFFLAVAAAFLPASLHAYTSPGKPTGHVNDFAGIISTSTKISLESNLSAFEASTSIQIAVVTVPSLGGDDIATYGNALFREWGIGQKDKNNGILFLVALKDRKLRIEVGYGLEGLLPDVTAGYIIDNIITPFLKKGDYSDGISNGALAIESTLVQSEHAGIFPATTTGAIAASSGTTEPKSDRETGDGNSALIIFIFIFGSTVIQIVGAILGRSKSWWAGGVLGALGGVAIGYFFGFVYFGIFSIVILSVLGLAFDYFVSSTYSRNTSLGLPLPWYIGGRGRGGRGGFGGGFGGFGGGSSGGGGASGSW